MKNLLANASKVYEVGPGALDPIALGWAAENLLDSGASREEVRAEVRALNRQRDRLGLLPVVFPWGHPLF